ncbi:hypothetical protein HOV93_22250 [Planctomycetes bacterium FF15]|uniref:Uncharacterized protein n=1 Tax=Bremerella alba TaxID=980252 RepID=A0A7V8V504_9BACT|nr:hypothetical protein [Bremerella alba]
MERSHPMFRQMLRFIIQLAAQLVRILTVTSYHKTNKRPAGRVEFFGDTILVTHISCLAAFLVDTFSAFEIFDSHLPCYGET